MAGNREALEAIINERPAVLNHNMERVERLYPQVRPQANYARSLELIKKASKSACITKSGLITGLGETEEELIKTLKDLRKVGCNLLTMGQYLPPSREHFVVNRYMTSEEFAFYETKAAQLGFKGAACEPLVRSSFRAEDLYKKALVYV